MTVWRESIQYYSLSKRSSFRQDSSEMTRGHSQRSGDPAGSDDREATSSSYHPSQRLCVCGNEGEDSEMSVLHTFCCI